MCRLAQSTLLYRTTAPQWRNEGQNLKAKASTLKVKTWTFKAMAIGAETEAFKHMAREEIIKLSHTVRVIAWQDR